MFAPSVGTMLNGEHAFATCGGPAWRRRQRRLRAFRRSAALHHTSGLRSTAVEPSAPYVVGSLPPVEEFSGPVYDQVHQELFTASVSTENIAEIPVVHEQVIVQEIPDVSGPFPHSEVFTVPVYDQVHQVQSAAGEMMENIVDIPVVQEQVIVPAVVDSLPLSDEFTGPVYDQVHQELVASSEMAENFAEIPVVHEQEIVQDFPEVIVPLPPAQEFSTPVYGQVHQVFVGMRPERLVDTRVPQRCVRSAPSVGAPVLAVQSLRGFDGVDNTAAKFLLQQALKKKKEEEEEERRKREEEVRADEKKKLEVSERKRAKALKGWDEEALLQLNRRIQAGSALSSAEYAAWYYWDGGAPSSSSKRKRKKKRKKKLPRSSSHSSLGSARRRLRQWHARFAGFLGDVPLRAVFPSVVVRPAMLGIMAGMDEKDSGALIVDSGSVMCKARFAGYDTPRTVFPLVGAIAVYARGDSTGAVLGQGDMPVVSSGVFHQTAQITVEFPQLPFLDKFVQISCRGAEADSHGPDCSSDHRDSPLAVFDRGDQRPCCAGRAASLWLSQLQFSDTLVTFPLFSTTGAWGLTVPNNCGDPAVAVLRSLLISLSWSRGDSHGLPARKTMQTTQLQYFSGGRCPCCAGRVPCPCRAFSTTGSWTR